MKNMVCVSTHKDLYLDIQKVRKYLISEGVTVLDFAEISIVEVHYVTRNMNENAKKGLVEQGYSVEIFSGTD